MTPHDLIGLVELKGRVAGVLRELGCDADIVVNGLEIADELIDAGTDRAIVLRLVLDRVQDHDAMDLQTATRALREDSERRLNIDARKRKAETGRTPGDPSQRWDLTRE